MLGRTTFSAQHPTSSVLTKALSFAFVKPLSLPALLSHEPVSPEVEVVLHSLPLRGGT